MIAESHVLLGWNMGVLNVILGGRRGYSGGKIRCARKKPPIAGVSSHHAYARLDRGLTTIVSAVVRYHEHDLPLEDVAVHQPTAYAGNIFVALHLFELAAQKPCGC